MEGGAFSVPGAVLHMAQASMHLHSAEKAAGVGMYNFAQLP